MTRFIMRMISAGLMVLGAGMVSGQDYPNKPIHIITAESGGGPDFTSRVIAQGISGPLGQPVIVENRSGIIIANETVSKAPPDGYTLLLTAGNVWITPLLQKMSYDPVMDLSPITLVGSAPNILVVHPSLPVKSVKELIALAKARPGELNYSSSATGTSSHLAGELFKSMAAVNIVRIPYKGGATVVNAMISGEVQLSFSTAPAVAPHVKSGRLRALAVTSAQLSVLFPGLPTVAATVSGFESVLYFAAFAPAKTPATSIRRLNQEIVRVLKQPDVREKFLNIGFEVDGSSPEDLATTMKSEMARLGKVIKDAGIKAD